VTGRRVVAVLTTGRQDWGIVHSTCVAIRQHPALELRLIAGGRHGSTAPLIRDDGFEPDVVLPWDDGSADAGAARTLEGLGGALREHPVEALLLVGDRYETAAAALAATLALVPLIHVHGGEQTFGAFDDALRNAITKLSHLHLVSHEEHRRRVIAMGEDPETVHVVGAPGLDAAVRTDLPDRDALAVELRLALEPPVVLVTVHPATLEADPVAAARAVVEAMDQVDASYVITLPNPDPGAADVRELLEQAAAEGGRTAVEALGERRYWGLLRVADAMLGNSSSALVEAPAVDLPAVDVGERQAGRRRAANVIDAPADAGAVAAALRRALDPATRATIRAAHEPLADGRAGERIADIIARWRPPSPPRKRPIRLA
jgi:UDP-hydrolysing UDP-N-acetyl-D-glucosamine 2-epimerase